MKFRGLIAALSVIALLSLLATSRSRMDLIAIGMGCVLAPAK